MFYEVAHRLYFPLIGENLAVVSYPLFGFDLFFRHPIAPSVWQEVQSLGEKVYLPVKTQFFYADRLYHDFEGISTEELRKTSLFSKHSDCKNRLAGRYTFL